MSLSTLLGAARNLLPGPTRTSKAAPAIGTICTLSLALGGIYLVDCRVLQKGQPPESCYFTAAALAGIGLGAQGGFQAGFNTLNPALRRPDDHLPERDASGRFISRRSDP